MYVCVLFIFLACVFWSRTPCCNNRIRLVGGRSDHAKVIGDLGCKWKANLIVKPKRLYHKADYEAINNLINEVNWETEFERKNIHQKWACFKNKLVEIINQCVPISECKRY